MRRWLLRDPFDLVPGASRLTRAAWLGLAACGLVLLLGVGSLVRTLAGPAQTQAPLAATATAQRDDPAALARAKAQASLRHALGLSWSGLFDALEAAAQQLPAGVSVASLQAKATSEAPEQVNLVAQATSARAMLAYIQALQAHPAIEQLQLLSQQSVPRAAGDAAGDAVRFVLSLRWRAQAAVPPWPDLPPPDTHLADVQRVLALAHAQGAKLGSIDYQLTQDAALPLVSHTLDLRLQADYTQLKAFAATLLQQMPHAYLQTLELTQADAAHVVQTSALTPPASSPSAPASASTSAPTSAPTSAQASISLRLVLVYRSSSGESFGGLPSSDPAASPAPLRLGAAVLRDPLLPLSDALPKGLSASRSNNVKAVPPLPQQAPAPAVPAAPTGPPALPFVAVGALHSPQPVAFVQHQGRLLLLREGDGVASSYRVESISPQAIAFTYLPLMQRQLLSLSTP